VIKVLKTILAYLFLAGICATCFGQGALNWSGFFPSAISAQTNSTQFYNDGPTGFGTVGNTAPTSSGLIYYYELLYNISFSGQQILAPDYTMLFGGGWLDTGLTATNNNASGRLAPVNPNVDATVPWSAGITNNILLVGWSANLGISWGTVSNEIATQVYPLGVLSSAAFFGVSATGFLAPNDFPAPGATVFAASQTGNGLPIYSPNMQLYLLPLTIVPEPSTLTFTALGTLGLLLRRRRQ
jgi:hypothetical protein